MIIKEILKKKIIYRSSHRGSKEMDLLLGNFVKKYIDELNYRDLEDLEKILIIDDKILYQWYFKKKNSETIPDNRVTKMLKNFKL